MLKPDEMMNEAILWIEQQGSTVFEGETEVDALTGKYLTALIHKITSLICGSLSLSQSVHALRAAITLLNTMAHGSPLTVLTDEPDQWIQEDPSGKVLIHKRCQQVKKIDGKVYQFYVAVIKKDGGMYAGEELCELETAPDGSMIVHSPHNEMQLPCLIPANPYDGIVEEE